LVIIQGILEDSFMKRWQNPPIETRVDVPRPYYFIRPYVPRPASAGLDRVRKRIPLGYCDEITMRQANERKQEIMVPINQGKFILQAQIRFHDLLAKYQEARLPKFASTTRTKYETHIANHILPVFGRTELADIDRQSIEAWLAREAQPHRHGDAEYQGLGWWALKDLRGILSAIFTAAADWGLWQGENPCARVRLGQKVEKREKRIPGAADLQRFLDALPDTCILPAEVVRLVVLTACVAGLRVSEVLALEPEDVNPLDGTLRVTKGWHRGEFGPTKSTASRRVRQIGPLAALLTEVRQAKQYIFEREPGLPPDDRDLQQHVLRPAAEAVGIYFEGFGMHTFRRLNISWRQEVGATPFEAQKAAGHSKPDTTWLYTITDKERELAHVEAIWQRLMPAKGTVQ
jgi:integrase